VIHANRFSFPNSEVLVPNSHYSAEHITSRYNRKRGKDCISSYRSIHIYKLLGQQDHFRI